MSDILVIVLILVGMAGLFWSARVYDAAVKRYKAQQAIADELQQRAHKILEREEAVVSRAEELLSRLEAKLPS